MKKLFALLLALALLAPACLAELPRFEDEGYETPEAAVSAYIDAMNAGDLQAMLSTFAIESWVDAGDPQGNAERLKTFNPSATASFPRATGYTRDLCVARRWSDLSSALSWQYVLYALHGMGIEYDGRPVTPNEIATEALYGAFADSPVNEWAGSTSIIVFLPIEALDGFLDGGGDGIAANYASENNQALRGRMQSVLGCEELASEAVLLNIAGSEYIQFMECARYDGKWRNLDLGGNLATLANVNGFAAGLVPVGSN